MKRPKVFLTISLLASLPLSGCVGGKTPRSYSVATDGNSEHGREIIRSYGCGACHIIPGVHGARGLVGPPLFYLKQRSIIAGQLPNSPDNLARWIQHPKSIEPKTAMPDLGLTRDQVDDVVAYLYTLKGPEGDRWAE